MGPVLGALASVGKEFLAEKAVGLLNGKDKQNEMSEASSEVPYDTSNEAPVEITNEYHSANDDNPAINTAETEGNLETNDISETVPETTSQVEATAEDMIPEANNTESEFSVDNVVIPGEQEATEEIQAVDNNSDTTNPTNTLDTTSIQPSSISLSDASSTMPVTSPTPSAPATDIGPTMQSAPSESSLGATENTEVPNVDQNDTLVEAIENKDPVAVENAIESDPEGAEKVLKDDTALDNEAVQAMDGGNDAEVNNEVVEDALKQDPEEIIDPKTYDFSAFIRKPDFQDDEQYENNSGMINTSDIGMSFLPKQDLFNYTIDNNTDTPISEELNNRIENSDTGIFKDKDWNTTYKDNPGFQDMIYARAQDGDWLAKRYMNALDRAKNGSFNDRKKLESWEKKLFKNIESNPEWKSYWDKSMSSEDAPTYDQLFGNRISDIKDLPLTDEEYKKLSAELEQITEENPELVQEALPNTPIAEEARQITDDSDTRNDEVNNEAVEDTIEIGGDKVRVYKPGEDPYQKVSDESDWINNPDYEPSEGADVYLHHDDDFAGPDELPATIEQVRDEDFVGPDEQLAIYNGGVPEEIYLDPIYDTSDYNFDWNYDIQTLGVESPEEIPDAPVENKEQAKAKQRLMHWFKSKRLDQSSKSGPVESAPLDKHNERLSMAGRSAGALSIPTPGSGSVSSASMGNSKEKQPGPATNNSIASKAPLPVALEDNQGREVSVNGKATTMPVSGKNGSMRSGSFGLMSKPSKSTKVGKPVGATSGGAYHTQSNGSMNSKQTSEIGRVGQTIANGKDALIERIRTLLKKLPEEKVSQLGFSFVRNTYKGKSLEQYDGYTLQNISKQLEELIGE